MDDIRLLLNVLPVPITEILSGEVEKDLYEIVLDIDRPLQYRVTEFQTFITDYIVSVDDIDYILSKLPRINDDGRVGIRGTLHRVSAVWSKHDEIIGLTIRIGRPYKGNLSLIEDVLGSSRSVLLVGVSGAGKTTLLRGISNLLSESRRVIVVDKSSEIGGEANPPHKAIGLARRFQVPPFQDQSGTMLYALESHTPQVIIVDEISTYQEAQAARTISQRGVQLIASAHGRYLEDIIRNPPLASLVGGVKTVTLSDEEAERRRTSKTVQERETKPTFDSAIEIKSHTEMGVYLNVEEAIDAILSGGSAYPEVRIMNGDRSFTRSPLRISLPEIEREFKRKKSNRK